VQETLNNWLPNSKNKSTVILNAIAPSRKKEIYIRDSSRVLRFLSVGRLVKDKNFELQLKMLAMIDGVTIDIAGDGPLKRELQILAEKLGVGDRVRFLGNVADMVNLYQQYDAYIHTATNEGFGLVVGEAMSAGLPVLVPHLPGIEEVAGDSGLFFDSNNLSELCKKVILIKDMNQNDYSNLCLGSLQRSNYFGIDQHVSKLEALYQEIS
jgi:glycosyltransferase involved in cell wall biosynthesis